jgi:cell division initiation protein
MRGYDPDEVDTFLAMVADEMEELVGAGQQARAEAATLNERLAEYRQMEDTMRETLITVQKAAEEKRKVAYEEADMVLKEAEVRAGNWIEDAHRSIREIKRELAKLRGMRDSYVTRLRMLVQAQLDMLKLAEVEEETPDETLDLFEEKLEELTMRARERVAQAGETVSDEPDLESAEGEPAKKEWEQEDKGDEEVGGVREVGEVGEEEKEGEEAEGL